MATVTSYYDWASDFQTTRVEFQDIMELKSVVEYLTVKIMNHEGDLRNAHWDGEIVKHPMGFNVYFVTVRYVLKKLEPCVASHKYIY